jgi:hypothetical protein
VVSALQLHTRDEHVGAYKGAPGIGMPGTRDTFDLHGVLVMRKFPRTFGPSVVVASWDAFGSRIVAVTDARLREGP